MAAYTATNMVGRTGKDFAFFANHNDRSFFNEANIGDMKFASHISRARMEDNIYIRFQDDIEGENFKEYEMNFYKKYFSESLEAQNRRHEKAGNRSRIKDMFSYYRAPQTCPEEQFLQIGDKENHPSSRVFAECVEDYINRFNLQYGSYCKLLDCGIHNDEATPHAHIRRVWTYDSRDGLKVGQTQALKQMGCERPDMTQEEGRFNNSKMTFTANDRALWIEVCRDHGIEIKESERNKDAPHLSKERFITEKVQKKQELLEDVTRQADAMEKEVSRLGQTIESIKGQLLSKEDVDRIPYRMLKDGDVKVSREDFDNLKRTCMEARTPAYEKESLDAQRLLFEEEQKAAKKQMQAEQARLDARQRKVEAQQALAFADTVTGQDILSKAGAYDRMTKDGVLPEGYEARQNEQLPVRETKNPERG